MDYSQYPATRAAAKATGAAHYFTGEPCKYGHVALRKTKGACVECLKVEWKTAAVSRADYFREYNRDETVKDKKHDWYIANREQVIAAALARGPEMLRRYRQTWKEKNLTSIRADTKVRRRKHREATPPWLTRKQKTQIRQLYQIAITSTQTTGEQYVVDHIYPLRSEFICGLHVPWNLRVITREENHAKSNQLPGEEYALAFPPRKKP